MKKWIGITTTGPVDEETHKWNDIKKDLIGLSFVNNSQIIRLPDNMKYIQGKTASAFVGSNNCEIESRYIGYIIGNTIHKIRINEKTSNVTIETEKC